MNNKKRNFKIFIAFIFLLIETNLFSMNSPRFLNIDFQKNKQIEFGNKKIVSIAWDTTDFKNIFTVNENGLCTTFNLDSQKIINKSSVKKNLLPNRFFYAKTSSQFFNALNLELLKNSKTVCGNNINDNLFFMSEANELIISDSKKNYYKTQIVTNKSDDYVHQICSCPKNANLIALVSNNKIIIYDTINKKSLKTFYANNETFNTASWNKHNPNRIACIVNNNIIKILNWKNGNCIKKIKTGTILSNCITWNSANKHFLSCASITGKILTYNLKAEKIEKPASTIRISGKKVIIDHICYNPVHKEILVAIWHRKKNYYCTTWKTEIDV